MKQRFMALAFGLIFCLPAAAQGQGDVGAATTDYPDPQCPRPEVKLLKPGYTHTSNLEDSGPAGSYNDKVKVYNSEAQAYDACMHAYINGANAELKRVQDDANQRIHQISESANTAQADRSQGRGCGGGRQSGLTDEAAKHR
jgi:hypothetical protein